MWDQLSTTFSNLLKQPNGELLVAVKHNQLRIMASETVDPIDWSHPTPSWAVLPERLVHSINQCRLSGTRTCNRSTRGNHLAYAATQGINLHLRQNLYILFTLAMKRIYTVIRRIGRSPRRELAVQTFSNDDSALTHGCFEFSLICQTEYVD